MHGTMPRPPLATPDVLASSGVAQGATQFVAGMIMLWSGTVASIPSGWALCNGSSGTPDLREKFVMGAGTTNPGVTGGSNADHSHSGGTTGAGSAHSHTCGWPSATFPVNSGAAASVGTDQHSHLIGDESAHTHSGGTTGTASSRPAYYALAYIMKL